MIKIEIHDSEDFELLQEIIEEICNRKDTIDMMLEEARANGI